MDYEEIKDMVVKLEQNQIEYIKSLKLDFAIEFTDTSIVADEGPLNDLYEWLGYQEASLTQEWDHLAITEPKSVKFYNCNKEMRIVENIVTAIGKVVA